MRNRRSLAVLFALWACAWCGLLVIAPVTRAADSPPTTQAAAEAAYRRIMRYPSTTSWDPDIPEPYYRHLVELIRNEQPFWQGSEYEPAIRFRLAEAERGRGRYQQAIEALEPLLSSSPSAQGRELLPRENERGHMPEFEVSLRQAIGKHIRRFPHIAADHALLRQAEIYLDLKAPQKAWESLETLRKKYPQGDHVQEDADLLRQARDSGWIPEISHDRWDERWALPGSIFREERRAHLLGLIRQESMCQKGQHDVPADHILVLRDLLLLYGPLLYSHERHNYAQRGLEQIEKGNVQGLEADSLAQAKALFTQMLHDNPPSTGPSILNDADNVFIAPKQPRVR